MTDDAGKLLLRVVLGVLMLLHGIAKVSGGVAGIQGMLENAGIPGFVAYGVFVGEVLAPIFLILGLYARVAAAVIAVNMVVAIALVHAKEVWLLGPQGGWALELQGFFLFTAIAIALMGPGRFSVNRRW